jgi:hypothetical protein
VPGDTVESIEADRIAGPAYPAVVRDDGGEGEAMSSNAGAAGGGAFYGLGIFGAWVWFFQQADAFWEYVVAVFQGLFWPAFMVYEVFRALAG